MSRNFKPLSETHPELAKEADGWNPQLFSAGSSKISQSWKCKNGHSWTAPIARRAGKQKSGCPYCLNVRVLEGFNDLATTHPALIHEVIGWNPKQVLAGSRVLKNWRCKNGHEWKAAPADRTGKGSGCPYCARKKVFSGFNDLLTEFPNLAIEAFGWNPSEILSKSGKKLKWKCKEGHTWEISPNARIKGGRIAGCPFCSNRYVWTGFNDLKTTHPQIASEAHKWDPTLFIAGTPKIMTWKCNKGHIYKMSIANRTAAKSHGCSVCAGRQINIGVNDFASNFPDLVSEVFGWDPTNTTSGSNVQKQWRCPQNHIYTASPKSRTGKSKSGCPYCARVKVLAGFNDLLTTHPDLAKEAIGWNPSEFMSGSHRKMSWKCKIGHVWEATIGSRAESNSNCPFCANRKLLRGFNDLQTTHSKIAEEAYGWSPRDFVAGSHTKVHWKCELGHIWKVSISDRTNSNSRCPTCFGSGFDNRLKGWFYLIEQPDMGFLQIGISNFPERRLESHGSRGWILLDIRGPMEGESCRDLETEVLRFLRSGKAKMLKQSGFEKFDGYTESWILESLPVKTISELMTFLEL